MSCGLFICSLWPWLTLPNTFLLLYYCLSVWQILLIKQISYWLVINCLKFYWLLICWTPHPDLHDLPICLIWFLFYGPSTYFRSFRAITHLLKVHDGLSGLPGHCPWSQWTFTMDSVDSLDNVHGHSGQSPMRPVRLDNVHGFSGQYPWTQWTLSMDSVDSMDTSTDNVH